jgi:type VI protein secretion system component VasK
MNTNVVLAIVATLLVVGGMALVAPDTVAWIAAGVATLGWIAWAIWFRDDA